MKPDRRTFTPQLLDRASPTNPVSVNLRVARVVRVNEKEAPLQEQWENVE